MSELVKQQNSKRSLFLVIFFLFAITLRYPFLLLYPFPGAPRAGDFYTIDLSIISSLSILMILVSNRFDLLIKSKKIFIYSLILFFSVVLIQFIVFDNYTFREFTFSISWVIISLAVYVYSPTFKKLIIPYFCFIWLFNLLYAIIQIYNRRECIGIPANRNWHAGLIIGCTPIFIFAIFKILKKFKLSYIKILFILAIPIFVSAFLLYFCYSRGAYLALVVTTVLFLILFLRSKRPENFKRIMIISSLGIILIFSMALLFYGDILSHYMIKDVRIPLWRGALSLFSDNLTIGAGSPSYESKYVFHIPIDRFIRSWYFTYRSDNPHNHILYLLGSFGLIGGFALLVLWFYPIITCYRKYDNLSPFIKLVFFSFFALSVHSFFDLIIYKWPTVFMALILQGILWSEVFFKEKEVKKSLQKELKFSFEFNLFAKTVLYSAVLLLIFQTYIMTRQNIYGSLYSRKGLSLYYQNNKPYSLYYFNKSIEERNNPKDLYRAGVVSLINLNDHILALKYLKLLEKHPSRFFAQANSMMASCYVKMNRKKDALGYMQKEVKIFPISFIAHYNKYLLEIELKRIKEANKTKDKLNRIIQLKSLTPEDVSKMLKNPELDGKYHLLKEK